LTCSPFFDGGFSLYDRAASCLAVSGMQARMEAEIREDVQIPAVQRRAPSLSLTDIEAGAESRNAAIVVAYATGAYSYQQIADHFWLHFTTVGKIARRGG
jgi:putative transposase